MSEEERPEEEWPEIGMVERVLECVRAPQIGCYDDERCWAFGFCGFSRDETRRLFLARPDPKPPPRIKDPRAIRRKVHRDRVCRCGCGQPATDGHHIVPRSLGGDDVEDNIIGLAHHCHMIYEFGGRTDRAEMASTIGSRLRDREIAYVARKRAVGAAMEFLARYYDLAFTADQLEQLVATRKETR